MSGAADIAGVARCEAASGGLEVDLSVGHLHGLRLRDGGREIAPLATAPWLGETAELPAGLPPVERRLSGDFLCAPFGPGGAEDAPPHGWSANSAWEVEAERPGGLDLRLGREIQGARLRKRLRLLPDAPLLLCRHEFEGGRGRLPVSHHVMVALGGPARLSASPKRAVVAPDAPLEPGRNRLRCPGRAAALGGFPAADGGVIDLTRLPIGAAHEDFVTLVEAARDGFGWTAVLRERHDDIVFVLRPVAEMPVTMLWHSNAGRDYAPWNGRHTGVLGIEDGMAGGAVTAAEAAAGRGPVAAEGVPTALDLDPHGRRRLHHLIGAIARPPGWDRLHGIAWEGDSLVLSGPGGQRRALPCPRTLFDAQEEARDQDGNR
ncbi:hypothetical protein [Limimaricola pyoseonensis]|uniref:Galactose mutarotase n=1 Tax=Limimaricola pyoseonensis TaxID=521013 RepID=A0A1G7HRN8_9RHOB|nr:hypothetical protein [Limimaricola pyoseonensis]SDF03120.1 hypothetical protein SAMN04488567_3270 [Limimaricola pyoseonensis]